VRLSGPVHEASSVFGQNAIVLACDVERLALRPVRLGDADEPECRMRGR
jgi:hypothetical protein